MLRIAAILLSLPLALAAQDKGKPASGAWDTGQPGADRSAWTAIPQGETPASFKGDAVISNGRITAVVRKQAPVIELGPARLALAGAQSLARVALVENTRGATCLEAVYKTAKGEAAAKFRLKRGEVSLEIEPGAGAERLRIGAPGRYVVLPDFFADDMVIDGAKIPIASVEVPSENFLLHLAGKGESIVMAVFENRDQDVKLAVEKGLIAASDIEFRQKKVWVALLEGAQVWREFEVKAEEAKKERPLDWKMPFPAAWRMDFTRQDGLTDSWEMLLQKEKDGPFVKPSWMGAGADRIPPDRKRWTTVLGSFKYPVWSDPEGKGYVQPLKHQELSFLGPAVVYPVNRVQDTPLEAFTVVDVVRSSLGVGPCEYILDLEGNKSSYQGRATCSVRDTLTPIYQKGQQKDQRAKVDKTLDDGLTFVKHIRGRIEQYVEFGKKLQAYLADQKKAHADLAGPIGEIEKLAGEIDARYAARREKMKTPEHVAKMNEEFRKNVLDDASEGALDKCKAYAKALVEVGDNQDELSGECRWVVRALRQKAGLLMATEPKMAEIATEIRKRTQESLRNPAGHEGARH